MVMFFALAIIIGGVGFTTYTFLTILRSSDEISEGPVLTLPRVKVELLDSTLNVYEQRKNELENITATPSPINFDPSRVR